MAQSVKREKGAGYFFLTKKKKWRASLALTLHGI